MRVGFDLTAIALNRAGERRYAQSLLRELHAADGVEVGELALVRRSPRGMFQRVVQQGAVEAAYYPLLLGVQARRMDVDLVHHPRHLIPPEWGRPGPSVVTVHDVLPLSEPELYPRLILWRYRVLARAAVGAASVVLTGSEHSAGEIERLLGVARDRIRVTPYGVEERFRPVAPEPGWLAERFGVSGPYVLCVGTLEPRKNLRAAVRAFELVRGDFPSHTLLVIGARGWQEGPLAGERVVTPGYVRDDELVRLYSGADCFLFPSFSEGFGFPVLEAMACGAPVLASNRTSIPEVVGDAGLLVDPRRPEEIAEALASLLLSHEWRAELARRGRDRASAFSWAACARETVAAYRAALA